MKKICYLLSVGILFVVITGCQSVGDSGNMEADEYEEMKVIENEVDLEAYSLQVDEDNSNVRILFYLDDQENKKYKSVYVKEERELKVIDVEGNELIYHETL